MPTEMDLRYVNIYTLSCSIEINERVWASGCVCEVVYIDELLVET